MFQVLCLFLSRYFSSIFKKIWIIETLLPSWYVVKSLCWRNILQTKENVERDNQFDKKWLNYVAKAPLTACSRNYCKCNVWENRVKYTHLVLVKIITNRHTLLILRIEAPRTVQRSLALSWEMRSLLLSDGSYLDPSGSGSTRRCFGCSPFLRERRTSCYSHGDDVLPSPPLCCKLSTLGPCGIMEGVRVLICCSFVDQG